jgi:hypothetical protein
MKERAEWKAAVEATTKVIPSSSKLAGQEETSPLDVRTMCPSDSEPTRAWYRANSAMHSPGYTHALDHSILDTTLSLSKTRLHQHMHVLSVTLLFFNLDGFRTHVGRPNCAFSTASSIEKMITRTCDIQVSGRRVSEAVLGNKKRFFA